MHSHPARRWRIALILGLFVALVAAALAQERTVPQVGCRAEWERPTDVLAHTPGDELFLGVLHPEAALFERAFDLEGAAAEHRAYLDLLRERGVRVHTVVEALLVGTLEGDGEPIESAALEDLRAFAQSALTIDASALPETEQAEQRRYAAETIRSLHPRELVRVILERPTVHLRPSLVPNTRYSATYELAPVMNLYFCRDQQITTARGVVMGRMNSEQRAVEIDILRFALRKLGVQPIYAVTGEGRLEGGDFLPAGDVAFIGQGLRTNAEGVRQLLENDVFGTDRVVVVRDPWQNQDQMHLDTYFNIVGPDLAVLVADRMDVRDQHGALVSPAREDRRCTIDVYQRREGRYTRVVEDGDFQEFLEEEMGFRLIAVPNEDQLRYGVNFLCVGPGEILGIAGVSAGYRASLAGVDATWMDFGNLTGGYGAAHCAVQVLHREPPPR